MYQTKQQSEHAQAPFLIPANLLHFKGMKRTVLSHYLFFLSLVLLLASPAMHGVFPSLSVYADNAIDTTNLCRNQSADCSSCFQSGGAWTAIGCLGRGNGSNGSSTLGDFIRSFIQIGVGMGGGIAFLLILFSGFQTMMSTGNPEKLHEAKELMTAAISGLLLIIFSVFLLRLIGVDILQIPGFG